MREEEKKQEEREEAEMSEERAEYKGPMNEAPQFEMMTNNGLQCRDCRFRIPDGGVLRCHKYDMKPVEVLNRVPDACPSYKPERG